MFWLKSFQNVLKLTPCKPICRCFCCLFTVSSVLCFIPYSSQRSSSQTFSCVIAVEVEEIAPWPKRERSTPRTMVRGAPSRGANGWKRWLAWFAHRSWWYANIQPLSPKRLCDLWWKEGGWFLMFSVPSSSARSCPTDHQSLLFIASSSYLKPSMYTSIQAHYFQQPLEKCIEMPWLGSVA